VAHLLNFNKNTVQRIFQLMSLAGEEAACGLSTSSTGHALKGRSSE